MGRISLQALADLNQQRQNPGRFMHILGVAHTAASLAARHGADPERASLAAWLHDLSKPIPPAEIEADMIRRGGAIDADDRGAPATWHGPHAALVARQDFGVEDEEVLQAVALHSSADAGMGRLARILFVADALEPTRSHGELADSRKLMRTDLDAAFARVLERKTRHVEEKGGSVSPRALRALAEIRERSPS